MLFILLNHQLGLGARSPEDTGTGQFPPSNLSSPVLTQGGGLFTSSRGSWTNLPTGYNYSWYINSLVTGGQTGSGLSQSLVAKGSNIYCRVGAINGVGTGYANSNTVRYPYDTPVNTGAPTIIYSGTDFALTNNGGWSGSVQGYIYDWYVSGNPVGQNQSYMTYLGVYAQDADVYCRVGAINADSTGYANSNTLDVPMTAPVNTVAPVVSSGVGQYTVTSGTWTGTQITGFRYQWYKNSVAQGSLSTTNSPYSTGGMASGDQLFSRIVAYNEDSSGSGVSNTVTFLLRTPFGAPVATVAPVASSGADRYYVSNTGTWTGQVDATEYQWFKNASPFAGQTGTGVLFSALAASDSVYCQVSKYNIDATGTANTNSFTYLVSSGSAPTNSVAPVIAIDNGSYYKSTDGTWSNVPTGYRYQWITGGNAVAGQTGTGYYATGLAQGTSVALIVSGINSFGTGTGVSNAISAPVFKQIYWQDNADNEDGFRLEWGTGSGVYTSTGYAAIDATGYLVPFETTGVYYVQVVAYNNATGSSGASNVLQVTV